MDTPLTLPQEQPAAAASARRYAIVLAGGSGTRLWPLSRVSMPKQLLALNGAETLLQQTARRLAPMVDPARIVTVTHADHRFEVTGQLHAVDPRLAGGVLAEPVARNTLPAIAWAAARIAREQPDALIGVFSSDHAVADAAAVGVPNEEFGEEVKAVVQPMPGVEAGAALEAELIAFCGAHLARQKCPRSVDFTAELPRLPTGKLYKKALRDRYWAGRGSRIV